MVPVVLPLLLIHDDLSLIIFQLRDALWCLRLFKEQKGNDRDKGRTENWTEKWSQQPGRRGNQKTVRLLEDFSLSRFVVFIMMLMMEWKNNEFPRA